MQYLGLNYKTVTGKLTINCEKRINFNLSVYEIFMNSCDLSELVKCELIVKKFACLFNFMG